MFNSLAGQNADILLITDDPDFPGESGKTICVESASEEESVFAMTAVLQLFAANLAQIRGTDPDKSRNLSKYTEILWIVHRLPLPS
jgi:fructoselysine-6-P-deglycase FrlB-like protein